MGRILASSRSLRGNRHAASDKRSAQLYSQCETSYAVSYSRVSKGSTAITGPLGIASTGSFAVRNVARSMRAELVLDALEQALWSRTGTKGVVHHSDRGSQYLSIRYCERLAEAKAQPSVGSVGDSYDNALAEIIIGLYKTEVIHRRGPWRHLEAVEYATLEWVDWFNHRRLLEPIGNMPPAELESSYYHFNESVADGDLTQTRSPPEKPGRFKTLQVSLECSSGQPSTEPGQLHTDSNASALATT